MTYSADVLAFTPIAYFRQGDPSGTTMTDSSGNGRNGTYTSSPTLGSTGLLTGDADTAVTFASASAQYALVADDNSMDGLSALTIVAWIKPTTISGTPQLVSRDTSGTRSFQFRLNATGTKVEFLKIAGGVVTAASATSVVSAGTAAMVAVVYNGTDIRIYVNGVLSGTPAAATGTLGTTTTDLQVATRRNNSNNAPTDFYNGVLDEVSIHGTALSAANIAALYASGSGSASVTVPVATATAAAVVPTVSASSSTAPPAATATAAAIVPVVSAGSIVSPPAATATATAVPPAVVADASVIVPVATATATALVPIIDVPGDATVLVPTATATAEALPPTLTWSASVAAVAATATADALAPTVTATVNATVTVPTATATATAIAPAISNDSPNATVEVPTATATATAHAPMVVGVYSASTDITNLAGGRVREATGAVTITRPVEAVPVSVGTRVDKAMAYPAPTMVDGRPT